MNSSTCTLFAMAVAVLVAPIIVLVWICRKVKPYVRPVLSAIVLGTLDHFRSATA